MATAPLRPTADELAPLFEGAPSFLARVCAAGPFASEAELFATAREIAHAMPESEQVELIDAHPRLGAPPASVSAMSFREQGYDRTPAADADAASTSAASTSLADRLAAANAAYEDRFGFRYCVWVAGRPREALLPGMAEALDADRAAELHRAIDAVVDIAIDRAATRRAESTAQTRPEADR